MPSNLEYQINAASDGLYSVSMTRQCTTTRGSVIFQINPKKSFYFLKRITESISASEKVDEFTTIEWESPSVLIKIKMEFETSICEVYFPHAETVDVWNALLALCPL